MSKAEEIFAKIMNMPLRDLLILCSTAIDTRMEKKRLDALLMALETRLQKKRLADQFGLSEETQGE